MKLICLLTAAACLGLAEPATATQMRTPKLYGTVGPGYTIALRHDGRLVRMLQPGKYTVMISDRATIHDFAIEGPGLPPTVITGDGFTGTKTVTIVFKRGTYTYFCVKHEPVMAHTFKVR